MYQSWVSRHQFRWTPILTYTHRYLKLLEWFEAHLEPVAFVEDRSKVGIALVTEDLRVTVERDGMYLESGMSQTSVNKLLPAIRGIFEVLEPQSATAIASCVSGSHTIKNADYEDECLRFARRASHSRLIDSEFVPTDASVVVDILSIDMDTQVEWGIVNRSELFHRLNHPTTSRLSRALPDVKLPHAATAPEHLPDVSVFTDMVGLWRVGNEVSTPLDVSVVMSSASEYFERLSKLLVSDFLSTEEELW